MVAVPLRVGPVPLHPRTLGLRRGDRLLVLVRHGQSEWNLKNLFTGWRDVDLTEQGEQEAREAGRLMAGEGLVVDVLHTSLQKRAIRTADLALGAAVEEGALIAVVEAMKMENVLRAERDGVVKSIKARVGDSLAVDAVIMEFA